MEKMLVFFSTVVLILVLIFGIHISWMVASAFALFLYSIFLKFWYKPNTKKVFGKKYKSKLGLLLFIMTVLILASVFIWKPNSTSFTIALSAIFILSLTAFLLLTKKEST